MDLSKLKNVRKLRKQIAGMRPGAANVSYRKLPTLAKQVGYKFQSGVGDEPRYVHERDSGPLTIPGHKMAPRTVISILDQMDTVLFHLETELEAKEEEKKHAKNS